MVNVEVQGEQDREVRPGFQFWPCHVIDDSPWASVSLSVKCCQHQLHKTYKDEMRKYIIKHSQRFPAHRVHQIQHAIDCKMRHIPLKKKRKTTNPWHTIDCKMQSIHRCYNEEKKKSCRQWNTEVWSISFIPVTDDRTRDGCITFPSPGQQTVS